MRERYYLVPLAYDYIQRKSGKGTMARIDALIAYIHNRGIRPDRCVSICTAGYSKSNPTSPNWGSAQGSSLAYQQATYIAKREPRIQRLFKPVTWGTFGETDHAIMHIKGHLNTVPHLGQVHVVISSNPSHLRRVRLSWKYLARGLDWHITFVPAIHPFSMKERLVQEPIKYIRDLIRFWRMHRESPAATAP